MSKAKALAASLLVVGLLFGATASQADDGTEVITPVTSASDDFIARFTYFMRWSNFFTHRRYIPPVVTQPVQPERPEGYN